MDNIIDKNIDHDMTCMQTIILMFDSGSHVGADKYFSIFTSKSTNGIKDVIKETNRSFNFLQTLEQAR